MTVEDIEWHNQELKTLVMNDISSSAQAAALGQVPIFTISKLNEIENLLKLKKCFSFERINFEGEDDGSATAKGEDDGSATAKGSKSGLFKAAMTSATDINHAESVADEDYTGYDNVWFRDNIHVAHTHFISGDKNCSKSTLSDLTRFWLKYKERWSNCILSLVHYKNDVMERPHIRFNGSALKENTQHWSHAQNDAIGYYLWFLCLVKLDDPSDVVECDYFKPEMVVLVLLFCLEISFWENEDNGHWEEAKKVEASSVGAVTAGLKTLLSLCASKPKVLAALESQYESVIDSLSAKGLLNAPIASKSPTPLKETTLLSLATYLYDMGQTSLSALLPFESRGGSTERETDGALLFLIYPLKTTTPIQTTQILTAVTASLQGSHGVRRYNGDSYWMANYKSLFSKETRTQDFSDSMSQRDSLLIPGQEAQWCIFDPIMSCAYKHLHNRAKQEFHLLRSLAQITGDGCRYGGWKCPESYYLEDGEWVVNDVCPLLWTQANLKAALLMMRETLVADGSNAHSV